MGISIAAKLSYSCHVRDARQSLLSCVSYEDLLVKAMSMPSSLAETKISQSNEFSPAGDVWYSVLQHTAGKTQVGESSF